MRKIFRPNEYKINVNDIDYDELMKKNIKLICFDVDNTLDYPDNMTTELLEDIQKLFTKLETYDFEILLASNNTIRNRVKCFADIVDKEYIEAMGKPFQKKYQKNLTINKYAKSEIVFVGDKIITDVLGGNRFGSYTILTDPLFTKKGKPHQKVLNFIDRTFCRIIGFKRGEYY